MKLHLCPPVEPMIFVNITVIFWCKYHFKWQIGFFVIIIFPASSPEQKWVEESNLSIV